MARLHTEGSNPLSLEYDPPALAFHAAKISLVEDIVNRRSWNGLRVTRDHEDGRTDLTIEGDVEHVISLLLTLHHHGAGLFDVEADTPEELSELNAEFSGVPAVKIELADPE